MNKSCENCQYCDDFDHVCLNGKSPNAFEFTFDTKLCNQWKGDVLESIDDQPDVDPESLRPTAHWINRGYVCGENAYECSACHQTEWRTSASRMKYCMFCGARMVNTDEKHCT